YLNIDRDIYAARKGFFYTYIGWIIGYTLYTWGVVSIADLKTGPVVIYQQRYYGVIALSGCFVLPMLIAYYGGGANVVEFEGGVFAISRILLCQGSL
ncbi:uncharacterized protein BP01DRAFT_410923, partial [Aspergillus saccharolyticus JOP 1030-1]